jgi:hypothetical protein
MMLDMFWDIQPLWIDRIKRLGVIVSGNPYYVTILSDNPVTVPPGTIKDIKVWGMLHEGRKLPVQQQAAGQVALGPVANDATHKALELEAHGQEGEKSMAISAC